MSNLDYDLSIVIIGILITIIIFVILTLLFREVVCWYFKINKLIEIQNNMINILIRNSDISISMDTKLGKILNMQTKNNIIQERNISENMIKNKNSNTINTQEIESLTDEKAKKLLGSIGYSLTKSSDVWKIVKENGTGIEKNVYTKAELYNEIKVLFDREKNNKSST
ncbi:MAG: hypothetical protein ACYDEX_25675 [Mobilitalea sp.]